MLLFTHKQRALLNMFSIHPWTSCGVYVRTENGGGVQTEQAAGPL